MIDDDISFQLGLYHERNAQIAPYTCASSILSITRKRKNYTHKSSYVYGSLRIFLESLLVTTNFAGKKFPCFFACCLSLLLCLEVDAVGSLSLIEHLVDVVAGGNQGEVGECLRVVA